MNCKGEYNLQQHVIMFVITCGILVTFGTFAYTSSKEYESFSSTPIDNEFSSTYNHIDDISKETAEISNKMENADLGNPNSNTNFYGDILSVAKIVFKSIATSKDMITGMFATLEIPPLWTTIAIICVVIMVSFSVVYMIFRPS